MNNDASNHQSSVIFLPGGVTPAAIAYGPLLGVLGDKIQPITKDLEVYADDAPPPDYGLEVEVEGIRRVAEAAGLKRFHLVGYSGGGACSLAFTAKYPERLKSLALIEPAWSGRPTPEDAEDWAELERVMTLAPDERMQAFMRWHMRPGVEPPAMKLPPGPPPAWMAKRPAGLEAISRAFNSSDLDLERFCQFNQPVYYALGSLSNRFFEREAKKLGSFFPDMQFEEYKGRSHFDPPHRAEPERFARVLHELWLRGDAASGADE
jgi:pimeloyl-ACP methyl ester carboxylesterase